MFHMCVGLQEPVMFSKFSSCIAASGDPILLSPETSELDFEVLQAYAQQPTCELTFCRPTRAPHCWRRL